MTWQDPEAVRFMLDDCKVWAVVGLSGDTSRTAYSIAALLQERGKQIVPIHPAAASDEGLVVLGEKGFATLADVPFPIDVVDVFRRSEAAGEFADQAVEVGARAVWFQLGVIDADAFDRTVAAGVPMVMDTCPAIEWRRRRLIPVPTTRPSSGPRPAHGGDRTAARRRHRSDEHAPPAARGRASRTTTAPRRARPARCA